MSIRPELVRAGFGLACLLYASHFFTSPRSDENLGFGWLWLGLGVLNLVFAAIRYARGRRRPPGGRGPRD